MRGVPLKVYVDKRFEESEKAIQAALAAAEKAVNKAETNGEKWRDNANEWRGAMGDRERDFMTRKEFYSIVGTAAIVFGVITAVRR